MVAGRSPVVAAAAALASPPRSALLGGSPCDVAQKLLAGLSAPWLVRWRDVDRVARGVHRPHRDRAPVLPDRDVALLAGRRQVHQEQQGSNEVERSRCIAPPLPLGFRSDATRCIAAGCRCTGCRAG
jgi:hypothetical protein